MSQQILPAASNHPQLCGIPNWPGYFAGADGSIWSAWRSRGRYGIQGNELRRLSAAGSSSGHLRVCLYRDGTRQTAWVHRLVLEAFICPCPEGMECRHLNGNPVDNSLANLQWGTDKENHNDKARHQCLVKYVGAMGVNNVQAKLTPEKVVQIRKERNVSGTSPSALARKFGVSRTQVRRILARERWPYVE